MSLTHPRFNWDGEPILVFGVLNLTPDSFSDGGSHPNAASALAHAREMLEQGADIIDVGGESTRPRGSTYGEGYQALDAKAEIARIREVVLGLEAEGIAFSIDTTKAEVARFATSHGAVVVNDTSCGRDRKLLEVVAESGAALVLMHNRGRGEVEGEQAKYLDPVAEIARELAEATDRAMEAGVTPSSIAWDPGLGFAKSAPVSMRVLAELPRLVEIGYPVFVGASRKSFLAAHVERGGRAPGPNQRRGASVAACVAAAEAGARALRVHDVEDSAQALALHAALRRLRC